MSQPFSAWQRGLRQPNLLVGMLLSSCLLLCALLSLIWTPWDPYAMNMDAKLLLPDSQHWLGTDAFGRDVLSQLMVGARSSIAVGVIAVGIGLVFGVALGLLASALRGWVEAVIMRLSDFTFAFPAILLAIMMTAVFGPSMVNAIIAIGIFNIQPLPASRVPRPMPSGRGNTSPPRVPVAKTVSALPSSTCCPTSWACSSCRPPFSLRWPFWPRQPCPIWALARSRPSHRGAACSAMPRP